VGLVGLAAFVKNCKYL